MPQDRETVRSRYAHDPGFRAGMLAASRKWRAANKDYPRKRYVEDPEYRERILAANRRWRKANSGKLNARRRKRYAEDPEFRKRRIAEGNAFRAAHKDRRNARQRARYATDAEYRDKCRATRRGARGRAVWLKTRYGMTAADYDTMVAQQHGVCAICKKKSRGRLHIDHSHETGLVRGLLCSDCNMGLGRFKDDPASLRTAAAYAESPPSPDGFKVRTYRRDRRGRPPSHERSLASSASRSERKETT